MKKYAMGGMTTTSETTKKPVKYVPTAREKKNLDDASHNRNARPIFTVKEQVERRKKLGLPTSEKEEKEYYAKMAREGGRNGKVIKKSKSGSSLKPVSSDKVGLKKLPTAVRNKMGYQKNGGAMKAKSGTSLGMKSVKSGYDDNSGVTRADFVAIGKGTAKSGAKMKMGGKMAKQAATAIAMKKAGKAPKATMKMGGKIKKKCDACK